MTYNNYIYIFIASIITYGLRVIPILLIKDQIKNKFICSFLYYVPYVTLAVMTFPAIIYETEYKLAGLLSIIIGSILAWKDGSLVKVAITCSLVVFVVEFLLRNFM